ncbi:MAG: hypothetical protein IJN48_00480 [Clostridia bacterium]|nr:hypothetical protein [Clostridia bacterium]
MAIYKRYNTRRKKLNTRVIISAVIVAVVFALTVLLGWYLGEKASGAEALYTGQVTEEGESEVLAPLSEKSVRGEYVDPEELEDFTAPDDETWASTWLYRDGKAEFATATDKKLGNDTKGLPSLDAFDTEVGTIGLFEVTGIYEEDLVKGIITEYERSLIGEFMSSGLDEAVLVFDSVTVDNYKDALEFADSIDGAKVVCVPYDMLSSQEFFSAAADRGLTLALMADGVDVAQLESDIETYAFYFTKYNIRLVLSVRDRKLLEVLGKHTILNYQFYS